MTLWCSRRNNAPSIYLAFDCGNGRCFTHSPSTKRKTSPNHLSERITASIAWSLTCRPNKSFGCISLCRSSNVFCKSSNPRTSYLTGTWIVWAFAYNLSVAFMLSRVGRKNFLRLPSYHATFCEHLHIFWSQSHLEIVSDVRCNIFQQA
jgi:hypothetical protein